ncbi:hypothetical protein VIGAN_02192700 [Vigna angularis var. angularis]|uniref:Uncharacterized protein n=1 Tax=Vigna angularis var. angularis TaxID=157739 RepID=A0A0S3RER0_PHAAN|nr:hypothetical protein VIGAN_02192700 [Vigna angularis var. angularis]
MNPETILCESMIYLEVEESKELLSGPCYNLNDEYKKDSFGSVQRAFNCAHGNAMKLIGNAFGRALWQLLATSRNCHSPVEIAVVSLMS